MKRLGSVIVSKFQLLVNFNKQDLLIDYKLLR